MESTWGACLGQPEQGAAVLATAWWPRVLRPWELVKDRTVTRNTLGRQPQARWGGIHYKVDSSLQAAALHHLCGAAAPSGLQTSLPLHHDVNWTLAQQTATRNHTHTHTHKHNHTANAHTHTHTHTHTHNHNRAHINTHAHTDNLQQATTPCGIRTRDLWLIRPSL